MHFLMTPSRIVMSVYGTIRDNIVIFSWRDSLWKFKWECAMYRLFEVRKSCRSKNVISRWFCLSLILLSAFVSCRLRPIDVEFMKRLDKCVNIVPVIAKADTLTIEEREAFRRRVSKATFSERPNEWHLKQTNKKLLQQQLNSYLKESVLLVISWDELTGVWQLSPADTGWVL